MCNCPVKAFLAVVPAVIVASALFAFGGCRWSTTNSTAPVAEPDEAVGPPLFREVTAESGVNFTYRNGEEADHLAILESLGGGLAVLDFDGDGLLDLFIPGGGHYEGPDKHQIKGNPCRLYRNLGNFRF